MPNLLRKQVVTTQDGEIAVQLTIDLNINVTGSGIAITATPKIEEEPIWEVPVFEQTPKIKFGKTTNDK